MALHLPTRPSARATAAFSDQVIATELPRLPAARRAEVVAFCVRRISGLPSPMGLGVTIVASTVAGVGRVIGLSRLVRVLGRFPLPVVGEYLRLVRSLSWAYVWETWPSTAPDGQDRSVAGGAGAA